MALRLQLIVGFRGSNLDLARLYIRMYMRKVEWIKKFILLGLSMILAIKAGDLLFGVFQLESSFLLKERGHERSINLREFNTNYSAKLTPTEDLLINTDSLARKEYTVETDNNGFIITGNHPYDSKEDVKKIVFLGGSTTEALYVSEEQRWESILEQNLNNSNLQGAYQVFNGGVSGNNTLHSILNLIAKVIPLKPDYVVLMHNVNDLTLLRQTGSYWNAPPSYSIIKIETNETLFLIARQLKDLLMPNIYPFIKRQMPHKDEFAETRAQNNHEIDIIENEFRSALITFITVCQSWNIEPILMTQFNRINLNDGLFVRVYNDTNIEEYVNKYHRLNEVIRDVGSNYNIDVIDLATLVPRSSDYLYDAVHLNDAGSLYVADILSNFWLSKLKVSK
jgi:lysophospholipase L1-like esterase